MHFIHNNTKGKLSLCSKKVFNAYIYSYRYYTES